MKSFLFLLLISGSALALPTQWRAYYLQSISKENVLKGINKTGSHCTGTLIKIANSCHLITSAHCFKSQNDYAFIHSGGTHFPEFFYDLQRSRSSSYDLFRNGEFEVAVSPLKKLFVSKDLAEIKLPSKLNKACEELSPLGPSTLSMGAYAAVGHYMSHGFISFTKDDAWTRKQGKVQPKKIATSLSLSSLWEIPSLTSYRGMSGGLLINTKKEPMGIITRNIPFRETTLVIGMDEVIKFTQEAIEPPSAHAEIFFEGNHLNNRSSPVGENAHGNGGENAHGNGGENAHGNGGENAHGNGGENAHGNSGENAHGNSTNTPIKSGLPLSFLRIPDEGVIDPENKDNLVLGKCGQQIDGYDDYIRLKDCHENVITRPKTGYPAQEVREDILNRMFSNLDQKILKGDARTPYYFTSVYIQDQWQKFSYGEARITARVRGDSLYIHSKGSFMKQLWSGDELKGRGDRAFELSFFRPTSGEIGVLLQYAKETPHPRGGTVYTLTYEELRCENKHYLKLICFDENDQIEIGLSKESLSSNKLSYHIAIRTGINVANLKGHELTIFNYGEVSVDEKGKLSDLPSGHPILLGL